MAGVLGLARIAAMCVAALVLSLLCVPSPAATSDPPHPHPNPCPYRKFDVFVMTGWYVSFLPDALTSSQVSPPTVSAWLAEKTMERLDREYRRGLKDCRKSRLRAARTFVETARPLLTAGRMDQPAVEEVLGAFDTYEEQETGEPPTTSSVERLHLCQDRLTKIHASYEIEYSGPKRYGRDGWVTMAVKNDFDRDLWVDHDGWMVAVRPLPRYRGDWSDARGGHLYWWGGSSSDSMIAEAGTTTEGYASPSWYEIRLRADGYIKTVRPQVFVRFGRIGYCSAPVWEVSPEGRA